MWYGPLGNSDLAVERKEVPMAKHEPGPIVLVIGSFRQGSICLPCPRLIVISDCWTQPLRTTCTAIPWKILMTRIAMTRTFVVPLSHTCRYINTTFRYEYDEDFLGHYSFPSHIGKNLSSQVPHTPPAAYMTKPSRVSCAAIWRGSHTSISGLIINRGKGRWR